ncbi:MAG: hypothetical protein IGQ88_13315 [Gloeomargaritaceae cyanobacterium C42_A2020_066]|nr:hypothetical protein [Gloeomargaritaceae cyanobacterium C42_A2020_066]
MSSSSPRPLTGLLVLVLLGTTLGTALGFAFWGYRLGQDALRQVRQPLLSPSLSPPAAETGGVAFLKEAEVVRRVKAGMVLPGEMPTTEPKPGVSSPGPFPISRQAEGVTLMVTGVEQQDGAIVVAVKVRNDGAYPLPLQRHLLLETAGGQALEVVVEGLPVQLAPGNEAPAVRMTLPVTTLGTEKSLALTLREAGAAAPYLRLSDIPIPSGG